MLFPATWADSIPEGFEVRSILGRTEVFSKNWPPGKLDQRFGFLAFGVVPVNASGEQQVRPGGYPVGWPSCPGCGQPALDGHITCGLFSCNEAGRR